VREYDVFVNSIDDLCQIDPLGIEANVVGDGNALDRTRIFGWGEPRFSDAWARLEETDGTNDESVMKPYRDSDIVQR
jgi:hypothetical protein